jgi:hypothetical protein
MHVKVSVSETIPRHTHKKHCETQCQVEKAAAIVRRHLLLPSAVTYLLPSGPSLTAGNLPTGTKVLALLGHKYKY